MTDELTALTKLKEDKSTEKLTDFYTWVATEFERQFCGWKAVLPVSNHSLSIYCEEIIEYMYKIEVNRIIIINY